MKSDYRFRDLDAQPVTPTHADACMEFAVNGTCRHTDPSNHSRVSDVVPSPENVSQVTSNANCEHLNKTVATVRGVPYHDCPDCGSVLDWLPQPLTDIERLRAINAQLVAALRGTRRWDLSDGPCWCDLKREKAGVNKLHMRGCDAARAALALNAAEKESNK